MFEFRRYSTKVFATNELYTGVTGKGALIIKFALNYKDLCTKNQIPTFLFRCGPRFFFALCLKARRGLCALSAPSTVNNYVQ
ncbi:hypothetical protein HanXRQr2_Chr12g0535381 [Helianthus annuus]|uniref:Uncharacterized protein n=1 Tax=Helianthus annuus TaxID=4232 RepID=A0A9K3HFK8_HELAN|nr:hypothetical protein HanXRQr2_Chr12g0535381 [Helianthus annuus]KAJ0862231.1 hypothetical protein HanPSC8_Chr12g0515691 [Helianthus annuus]